METGICSEMKKKNKRVSQPSGLIRCSSLSKVKVRNNNSSIKKKKKKKKQQLDELSGSGEVFSSIKPLFTTITKTTTTTTSITIFTPPEEPNNLIDIYLCLKTEPGSGKDVSLFQWFKIDPTNTTVEAEVEVNAKSISKPKPKPKSEPVFLTPISTMRNTTPLCFCAIPHFSTSHKKKKLVYAIGGISDHSQKAFVCDFGASTSPPFVWEELPSMPCPIRVYFGAASPLNSNIYAFGEKIAPEFDVSDTFTGVVFDQASRSWNPCPHPFNTYISSYRNVVDYAPVHTKDSNELILFNEKKEHVALDLTTGNWKSSFCAPVPKRPFCYRDEYSSCVAVGDVIYGFINRKLYALDLASKRQRFKRVYGLEEEMPISYLTAGTGYLAYLGKGKFCIVWGEKDDEIEEDIVQITCLKFWVGVCDQMNQLHAVVDRCEHYSAHGYFLKDVVAF
ncbi:hypothetical protein LguiA_021207 [Lonicera macranthoides]